MIIGRRAVMQKAAPLFWSGWAVDSFCTVLHCSRLSMLLSGFYTALLVPLMVMVLDVLVMVLDMHNVSLDGQCLLEGNTCHAVPSLQKEDQYV